MSGNISIRELQKINQAIHKREIEFVTKLKEANAKWCSLKNKTDALEKFIFASVRVNQKLMQTIQTQKDKIFSEKEILDLLLVEKIELKEKHKELENNFNVKQEESASRFLDLERTIVAKENQIFYLQLENNDLKSSVKSKEKTFEDCEKKLLALDTENKNLTETIQTQKNTILEEGEILKSVITEKNKIECECDNLKMSVEVMKSNIAEDENKIAQLLEKVSTLENLNAKLFENIKILESKKIKFFNLFSF